jgi:hypothetical protein
MSPAIGRSDPADIYLKDERLGAHFQGGWFFTSEPWLRQFSLDSGGCPASRKAIELIRNYSASVKRALDGCGGKYLIAERERA